MRPGKISERARRKEAPAAVPKKPGKRGPPPPESTAGEEDPGASLGDPAMQEAMRAEAQVSEGGSAAHQDEQSRTALGNVREGYGGKQR